uniref:uncharacterized protein LOC105351961 n=1 Tax=Fragaria vesca subsp. vesca TaxID=101020 RepID=UPI0005C8E8DA|nr:PREDICTED: uncharacterized protein LOC105351961 [Fragaria vesca subsp. vesca]
MDIRNTCLTCGSGAFREIEDVMVNCSKCKEYRQHLYCLEMSVEEYFHGGRMWYCEGCQGVKPATSFYCHDDLDDCESMDTGEGLQSSSPPAETSSTPDGTDKNLKANKTAKMKKNSEKKKYSQSIVDKTVLETILECNEEAEDEDEGSEINCDNCQELVHDQEKHVPEKDQFDAADDALEMDEDGHSTHVAAQSVAIPTWRGSLKILNNVKKVRHEIIGGLAHLSSIACPKVLEESKFLKTRLVLDLVRRTDVWPKVFDMYEPSDQSIALYFFPDSETDETDEKSFNNLIGRMMQEDLAMIVDVEKAELLIFTSSMLPKKYQRVNSKMYLWGVFKEKCQVDIE